MRKGTFSVQKATSNSTPHNNRTNPPKYLIGLESGSENFYELIKSDDDFILEAQQIYKEKIKQSMQKKQVENLIQETVLTLKKNQNQNDVKELFKSLNKKFGGHELLEISVHRDEGHFEKNGIAYYPTKNILKKENEWFICSDLEIDKPKEKDFDKKVDINEFKKVYNYHAHAKFSMFDRKLGKSARMQKKDMSNRIKFVSDYLGLKYSPETKSRLGKSVNQVKNEHLAAAREKEKNLAAKENLTKEIKALRTELQANKATRADYAELEELNRLLKEKVKVKDLTIETMQIDLQEFKHKFFKEQKEKEHYKALVEVKEIDLLETTKQKEALEVKIVELEEKKLNIHTLKTDLVTEKTNTKILRKENDEFYNQNKSLQEQNKTLAIKVVELQEKIDSRPNMDDYKQNKKQLLNQKDLALKFIRSEDIILEKNTFESLFDFISKRFEFFNKKTQELTNKFGDALDKIKDLTSSNKYLKEQNEELKEENEYLNQRIIDNEMGTIQKENNAANIIKKKDLDSRAKLRELLEKDSSNIQNEISVLN